MGLNRRRTARRIAAARRVLADLPPAKRRIVVRGVLEMATDAAAELVVESWVARLGAHDRSTIKANRILGRQ